MTSEYNPNTFDPNNIMLFGANYKNPYMGELSPALQNSNVVLADTLQFNNPSLATKLRNFNSQYGSTIVGGLQGAAGLWSAFNGMQQNKLVKQQMANSLNQWDKNYANQVAAYNTRLEDRQNARVAANPNAYESTDSYMAKNRLK